MNYFDRIPIIQQALFLLQEAAKPEGIKLTQTGSLNRNFVQSFWDQTIKVSEKDSRFRPTRELECPEATRICFFLSDSKYVRKFKSKLQLTSKGKAALQAQSWKELYGDLLHVGAFHYDWGTMDRFPEYLFVQDSVELFLEKMLSSPQPTIRANQLFDDVLSPYFTDLGPETKKELCRCLQVRFLERFCIPFGLLEDDQEWLYSFKNLNESFVKTEFFKSHFQNFFRESTDDCDFENSHGDHEAESEDRAWTAMALKFWEKVEPRDRLRMMNDVFCVSCMNKSGIGNLSGKIKDGQLLLNGTCTRCGDPVARLVEREAIRSEFE